VFERGTSTTLGLSTHSSQPGAISVMLVDTMVFRPTGSGSTKSPLGPGTRMNTVKWTSDPTCLPFRAPILVVGSSPVRSNDIGRGYEDSCGMTQEAGT